MFSTLEHSINFYKHGRSLCKGRGQTNYSICRNSYLSFTSIHLSQHSQELTSCGIHTNSHSRSKNRNPPGPPNVGPLELPTLDASPFLDSTLYIKKSSKASHTIGGVEATRRLLLGQNEVRSWIWNKEDQLSTDLSKNIGKKKRHIEFGLLGHGVPHQLMQHHVDTAWQFLNDLQNLHDMNVIRDKSDYPDEGDEQEVVECEFNNVSGWLKFDCVKVQERDGKRFKYPFNYSAEQSEDLERSIELYLTVMKRISNAFGKILISGPNSYGEIQITPDNYWKKEIPTPMRYWSVTLKRGFVQPSSVARAQTNVDATSGWTCPPTVQLIPGIDASGHKNRFQGFVKVIVQGIPSVFWKDVNEDEDWCGEMINKKRKHMVPISLCFEASFGHSEDSISNI